MNPKGGRVYDPKAVQYHRDRAKLGVPLLKQPLAGKLAYECAKCGAIFMNNEGHRCGNG